MSMDWIAEQMARLGEAGLERSLRVLGTPQGPEICLDGTRLVNFCSNDYLGLASDPRVIRAAQTAAARWGAGAGASRLIAGNLGIFARLEDALARLKGAEACLLFTSGYHANLGVIPALVGKTDAVFSDRLNHASIIDGCRLSRTRISIYEHNDPGHLDRLLSECDSGRKLVVTETLFSMEGDIAPLDDIIETARRHRAMVMVDDAHATGVLGPDGSGALAHLSISPSRVDVVMGTLGKALGSSGAFVCGGGALVRHLVNRARTFIFTTGPAPAAAGAALEALRIASEEPWRRERVVSLSEKLRSFLEEKGIQNGSSPGSPIIPVVVGPAEAAMEACARMLALGVYVQGIRPPTVPEGGSRLRIAVSASHSDEHVDQLLDALEKAVCR